MLFEPALQLGQLPCGVHGFRFCHAHVLYCIYLWHRGVVVLHSLQVFPRDKTAQPGLAWCSDMLTAWLTLPDAPCEAFL